MDDEIYKQAIRKRCEQAGIVPARREVQIKARYRDFEKPYYMDLLFSLALMVEAKTRSRKFPSDPLRLTVENA